jgi:hypothetical protein
VYDSSYSDDELTRTVGELEELESKGTRTWCIFDNTAEIATRLTLSPPLCSFDDGWPPRLAPLPVSGEL